MAAIVKASTGGSSNGRLLIRITVASGFGSNVALGTLADNDLLAYNSTNNRWENKTLSTLDILTQTNAATTYLSIATAEEDYATKDYVDASTPNFIGGGAPDSVYLPQDSLDGGTPDSEYA
jgi:hypothetical protein